TPLLNDSGSDPRPAAGGCSGATSRSSTVSLATGAVAGRPRSMRRALLGLLVVLAQAPAARADSLRVGAGVEWRQTAMGNALGGGMHLAIPFVRLLGVRAIPVAALAGPVAGARVQRLDPATRRALERTRLARAVVRAALRARDADGEARRLDGLSARARLAAGLPDLVLRAARSTDASLRVSP